MPPPSDANGHVYFWQQHDDGRYSRSYEISERLVDISEPYEDFPEGYPEATVSVMGEQYPDGTVEREVSLEGPILDRGWATPRQARELAEALLEAAAEVGDTPDRSWIRQIYGPPNASVLPTQHVWPNGRIVHCVEIDVPPLSGNAARELAQKLISAADELDKIKGDSSQG